MRFALCSHVHLRILIHDVHMCDGSLCVCVSAVYLFIIMYRLWLFLVAAHEKPPPPTTGAVSLNPAKHVRCSREPAARDAAQPANGTGVCAVFPSELS